MEAFCPSKTTVNIDVGATTVNVRVSASRGKQQVRMRNDGSATVFIAFGGDSGVVATLASGLPVGSGVTEVLTVGDNQELWVAAIAAGSTGKIYFTAGSGV